ncbi:MAG: CHAT domain-containing tetratricopeptide repeat protein [Bacteroidota bacterium]
MKKTTWEGRFCRCMILLLLASCLSPEVTTDEDPIDVAHTEERAIQSEDKPEVVRVVDSIRHLTSQGQFTSALKAIENVTSQFPLKDHELEDSILLAVLNLKSEILWRTRKLDQAVAVAQEALALGKNKLGGSHLEVANAYTNLGVSQELLGAYDSAEKNYHKALAIQKGALGSSHPAVASTFENLGLLSKSRGSFDEAITYFEDAQVIIREALGPSHYRVAQTKVNLGIVYRLKGWYDRAIQANEEALPIFLAKLGEDHPKVANIYNNLASIYEQTADFQQAKEYYRKALNVRVRKFGEQSPSVAESYVNLGGLYKSMGAYDEATDYVRKGLFILVAAFGHKHIKVASAHSFLGIIYTDKEDYTEAIKHLRKSIDIKLAVLGANHVRVAAGYLNLGIVMSRIEEYDQALDLYQQAEAIIQERLGKSHIYLGNVYNSMGGAYKSTGAYKDAITCLNRSIKIRKRHYGTNHPQVAITMVSLGNVYQEMGNIQKASECAHQALKLLRYDAQAPQNFERITDLNGLRLALILLKDIHQFRFHETGHHPYLDTLNTDYRQMLALEDYIQLEYVEDKTRRSYAAQALPIYEGAITHLMLQDQPEELFQTFELAEKTKNRQMLEVLRFDATQRSYGIPDSLLHKERDIDVAIGEAEKQIHKQTFETDSSRLRDSLLKTYENDLFTLKRERTGLRELFKNRYPAYHQLRYNPSVISLAEVQQHLLGQTHDALVEYFVGDSNLYTWVVLSDTFHLLSTKLNVPLANWVEGLRCALLAEQDTTLSCTADYAIIAHQLYQKLFASVDSLLPSEAAVLLVPDGVLGYLPFEVLLTEPNGQGEGYASYSYLLRDHPISYAYSATLQQEMQRKQHQRPPNRTLLAVAPSFTGNTSDSKALLASRFIDTTNRRSLLSALAYNVPEAQSIVDQMNGDPLIGEDATEAAFVQKAHDYRILHLSTHGKANDQAGDYSFLAFHHIEDDSLEVENEWLYNSEIYNLQLNADLVVLSACETGIGELQRGEGIISLARGFSYAGAKSLVTSLWNVNDRSTKELMEGFYRYLAEGRPKHLALRQAKLDYLDTHPDYLQSPFYWAAFIPIGDMEPIKLEETPWKYVWGALLVLSILGIILGIRWKNNGKAVT